ncbi:O-antigen ligase family protein [Variovorax paradoxus]|uniref:O-antigen ligase family protein n=1 Tax=Variovorax paradoxus TaxID=34073 RepID=UPI003ECF5700
MRAFLGLLISFFYAVPLGLLVSEVGDKPVNIVFSDFFWIVIPLFALLGFSLSRRALIFWAGFLYFLFLGIWGTIELGGELGPLFSALSFFISTIHIVAGAYIYRKRGREIFGALAVAFASVAIAMLFSDILLGSFPRGCGYEGRWGGCILGLEVYGFPNSSATLMVLSLPLVFYEVLKTDVRWRKILLIAGIGAILIMTPLSLSRTAFVTLGSIVFCYFFFMRPTLTVILAPVAILSWIFASEYLLSLSIFEGIVLKTQNAAESGDVSTGRFSIWQDAFRAFSQSPIFGHKFQYFSNFSEYGTAHQQYMEILFKSGLIGGVLYFGFFFYVLALFFKSDIYKRRSDKRLVRALVWAFVISLALSCFFQPTLSYQSMANLIFMLSGMVLVMPRGSRLE